MAGVCPSRDSRPYKSAWKHRDAWGRSGRNRFKKLPQLVMGIFGYFHKNFFGQNFLLKYRPPVPRGGIFLPYGGIRGNQNARRNQRSEAPRGTRPIPRPPPPPEAMASGGRAVSDGMAASDVARGRGLPETRNPGGSRRGFGLGFRRRGSAPSPRACTRAGRPPWGAGSPTSGRGGRRA